MSKKPGAVHTQLRDETPLSTCHPVMMTELLVYADCVGIYALRRIARRDGVGTVESVGLPACGVLVPRRGACADLGRAGSAEGAQ